MSGSKNRQRPLRDVILWPMVYPAAAVLKRVRRSGVERLPRCKQALMKVGVFPIRNHFYEPQFDMSELSVDLAAPRALPGVDLNIAEQLRLLDELVFGDELADLPLESEDELQFGLRNGLFEAGDAEFWYQMLRRHKPRRVFEIGSGHSTLMTAKALERNRRDDPNYRCKHVSIEPYEMPWLERLGIEVLRRRVEDFDTSFFQELEPGDFLFIDSSHVIRPGGDVVFEYLQLLPALRPGVIVHVHDIFTPRNYPDSWVRDEVRFWNEQYLLEAFLTHNDSWRVLASVNHLRHEHFEALQRVCPHLTTDHEPGSFYLQRVR